MRPCTPSNDRLRLCVVLCASFPPSTRPDSGWYSPSRMTPARWHALLRPAAAAAACARVCDATGSPTAINPSHPTMHPIILIVAAHSILLPSRPASQASRRARMGGSDDETDSRRGGRGGRCVRVCACVLARPRVGNGWSMMMMQCHRRPMTPSLNTHTVAHAGGRSTARPAPVRVPARVAAATVGAVGASGADPGRGRARARRRTEEGGAFCMSWFVCLV